MKPRNKFTEHHAQFQPNAFVRGCALFFSRAIVLSILAGISLGGQQRPAIAAVAPKSAAAADGARSLFDGATLAGWKPSGFDDAGEAKVEPQFRDGRAAIVIESGAYLSGISWTKEAELPRMNYEISLE